MLISVVNFSRKKSDLEVQEALRVINRQIAEDFAPYWHRSGELRLEGRASHAPDQDHIHELRGDAILYLQDEVGSVDALGYHDIGLRGVPYGFVFLDLAEKLDGGKWTVTLSHEALEMLVDPEANLLVRGPHPEDSTRQVHHWYEVCDAVQAEHYEIDGIPVSNFVLPLYFTEGNEKGSRNDFIGAKRGRGELASFSVGPGGYVGFYDPETGDHETFLAAESSSEARRRMELRSEAGWARRGIRHQGELASDTVRRQVTGCAAGEPLPGPWFEGFDVDIRASSGTDAAKHLRAAARSVLGTGWERSWTPYESRMRSAEGRTHEYQLVPNPQSRGGARLTSQEAWELTYALRKEPNVLDVEPGFVFLNPDVEALDEPRAARRSSVGKEHHLPQTEDPNWCADAMNLGKAWPLTDGSGVRIGHPDTGYASHPEIREVGDGGSVRRDLGWDFEDDDSDPHAELDEDNLLPGGPNHGTATASVLASPSGSQTSDPERFVVGMAPGAEVVPFRVGNSVVHFSQRRITQAIEHAVAQGCAVVSISLGGPFPSRRMQRTLRWAAEQGVVVVAAAGNRVPFGAVVYPARYEEVVAVAASNVVRRPWSGSSHGATVDITAPGESVWRAKVVAGDNGRVRTISERSSGTSYATAHVAGICALWIAHHGFNALRQRYGARVGEAFRAVLRDTAQPGDQMDPSEFVGLIDAGAVLAAELPDLDRPRRRAARLSRQVRDDELERFRALLPHRDDERLSRGLRILLGVSAKALVPTLRRFGSELAFQLATDPRLLRDFDAATRGVRADGTGLRASATGRDMTSLRRRFGAISTSPSLKRALGTGRGAKARRRRP